MNLKRKSIVLFLSIVLLPSSLYADLIYLSNGNIINGYVITQEPSVMKIEIKGLQMRVNTILNRGVKDGRVVIRSTKNRLYSGANYNKINSQIAVLSSTRGIGIFDIPKAEVRKILKTKMVKVTYKKHSAAKEEQLTDIISGDLMVVDLRNSGGMRKVSTARIVRVEQDGKNLFHNVAPAGSAGTKIGFILSPIFPLGEVANSFDSGISGSLMVSLNIPWRILNKYNFELHSLTQFGLSSFTANRSDLSGNITLMPIITLAEMSWLMPHKVANFSIAFGLSYGFGATLFSSKIEKKDALGRVNTIAESVLDFSSMSNFNIYFTPKALKEIVFIVHLGLLVQKESGISAPFLSTGLGIAYQF